MDSVQTQTKQRFLIIYDTDVHGGLSGLIAVKTLQKVELEIAHHFSNFAQQPPASSPSLLPDTLPALVQQHMPTDIILLDIPIDSRNPQKFVAALAHYIQLTAFLSPIYLGLRVLYIDHHEVTPYHAELVKRGVNVVTLPTSYQMSMYLPTVLNAVDGEIEKFALIAAAADFDETIADRISLQLEEEAEMLDTAWKGKLRELEDVKKLVAKYGNVGAVVQHIIEKNIGPDDLLRMARELGTSVPDVKYEVVGNVALAAEPAPQGLGWKIAAKLCRITQTPVAVVIAPTPQQKFAVLAASYWRVKSRYASLVDQAVREVAQNRVIIGHPGARSIEATDLDDARKLANEVARKLNELISTTSPVQVQPTLGSVVQLLQSIKQRVDEMYEMFRHIKEQEAEVNKVVKEATEILNRYYAVIREAFGGSSGGQ